MPTRAIVFPRQARLPIEMEPASRSWDRRQMQSSPSKPPFNQTGAAVAVRVLQATKELRRHPLFGYTMAFVFVGLATLLQRTAGSLRFTACAALTGRCRAKRSYRNDRGWRSWAG